MNDFKGKTLLVMDRTSLGACAVKRAKELGIKTIVANFYSYNDSPSKQEADEYYDMDISQIDAMTHFLFDKKVDGIFVGWTDSHLPYYAEICEKAKLPCCATKEQFLILSNDKHLFKQYCNKYDIPTAEEYKVDINFTQEDLDKIVYPVMVKPADGSGGRGIKRCDTKEELISHYSKLYNESKSKKIICERFIDSKDEIFLNYTIQDGCCSLSAAYMSYKDKTNTLHVYPSSHIKKYQETQEPKVIKMFQELGLQNAVLSLQGFVENGDFCFHETGLRMGGGQSYVFTQALNNISALDMMIDFSLNGKMSVGDVRTQDNPYFTQYAVNFYIKLSSGKIEKINGVDSVKSMPQVLQLLTFKKIGDVIPIDRSTDSVIFRMHVMDSTPEKLAKTLETISNTLLIVSDTGDNMQEEPMTYEKALEIIKHS